MRLAWGLLLAWFLLDLALAIGGWFERFSSGTLFAFGAVAASTGFAVLHWRSSYFRRFLRERSLKVLTVGQTLRFYGILAFFKASQHVLPALFAIPTGIIDVIFAASSFAVASRLVSPQGKARRGFVAWHVLGLAGLATSAILAILTESNRFGLTPDGVTSQAMTRFPISIVPTFIGPLVLIFHLQAIAATIPLESPRGTQIA